MTNFDPGDYWEKRLTENFSLVGVGSRGLGQRYNEWLYRVRKYIFPRLVKKLNMDVSQASVLDIGSGTGFYIDRWKELHAGKITGADITSVVVETLSQKHPDVTFYKVDIGQDISPLAGQQFDIVSCMDVLFHIVDDDQFAKAIRNIYALVKPGGHFIFSDNFLHGDAYRIQHQVSRSLQEIESLVAGTGFQILGRYPMFILMAYPLDSSSRSWNFIWRSVFKIVTLNNIFGFIFGAVLFPIELLCLSIFKESPTTEMMICKKNE